MRALLLLLAILGSSSAFASVKVQDVAVLLGVGEQGADFSGVNSKDISCMASLSVHDGKLEGSVTYGDTGARVETALTARALAQKEKDGSVVIALASELEPSDLMTLTFKDKVLTSVMIEGDDSILFIPRRFHVGCGQLEKFVRR